MSPGCACKSQLFSCVYPCGVNFELGVLHSEFCEGNYLTSVVESCGLSFFFKLLGSVSVGEGLDTAGSSCLIFEFTFTI